MMWKCDDSLRSGRRLLLASSSVVALLIGGGTPAAFAQCAISPTTGQSSITNSAAINCINIDGVTVNGNVTNTAAGTLTATGGNRPTRTGITIVNHASIAGAVINAGHITTPTSGTGIFLKNSPSLSGGITNSGTMSVGNGIVMTTVAQFGTASFGGGIVNAGTITAAMAGISIGLSSHLAQTFYGGISNSGTIAAGGSGFNINSVSMFSGGISNSGILSAASGAAINLANISVFSGGISNSGTISAHLSAISVSDITSFTGGIGNSGTISSTAGNGILFGGNPNASGTGQTVTITISAFSGGISNSGTISVAGNGIQAGGNASIPDVTTQNTATVAISVFSGGISNSGTISAGGSGIWAGGNAGANVANGTCCGGGRNDASVIISNFAGGISNSGTITAGTGNGIFVGGNASVQRDLTVFDNASVAISTFSGGITNSGTISAGGNGIWAGGNVEIDNFSGANTASVMISSFSGGISNSGTISASGSGIRVGGSISLPGSVGGGVGTNVASVTISTFSGGISNSGTISAGGAGIWLGGNADISTGAGQTRNAASVAISTFSGGINNSGTISAGGVGILIGGSASGTFPLRDDFASVTISTFSGGIGNSGKIVAQTGIVVNNVLTFLGAIANSGTITGTGGTAIDVTGASNAITIDQTGGLISGAIRLSANADQLNISGGTIAGNIVGAGSSDTINFNPGTGNTFTYANTISGVNNLNFISGTVVLDGTIATGGGGGATALAIAAGGRLLIGSNTASIAPGITDNGAFGFAQSGAFSFGNIISGSGLVAQLGPGTTTLTGANLYSGGTVVSGGTLTFSGAGRLGAASGTTAIDVGGTLDLGGTTQTQAAVNLAGGVLQNGDLNAPINSTGGTINGIGGGASLTTTAGVTFVLGTNTYAGQTVVNGGVLDVIGSITDPTVNSGGLLMGTGAVGASQINSGGTLRPGSGTAGTSLTISGSLAFQSGARYLVDVDAATASKAIVSGPATLAGNVQANFASGSYAPKQYLILESTGRGGTTFSGVTTVGLNNFAASLSYGVDDVFLNLIAALGAGAALGQNQQNVANAISTYFNGAGNLPPGFANLFNLIGANLSSALTQLDGEDATGAERGAFQLMNQFLQVMLDPTAGGGGVGSGGATGFAPDRDQTLPSDVALAYAKALKAPPTVPTFDQRWSAWGSAFGGTSNADGNAAIGSNNVTTSDFGYAAGMDYRATPNITLGFGLGGGGTNWNLAQGLGSGRSDSFEAGVYAKSHWGPLYLSGALALADHWFTTNRVAFGDPLQASFNGQSYAARGEAGYRFALPVTGAMIGVTPYAALQVQDFHTPNYSETDLSGGGFGLSYAAINATDTRSEVGARFDNLQIVNGMPLVLRGHLAWAHDWVSNPTLGAVFQTLPGSNFIVNGAPLPKDSALVTAAAELHITGNWTAIAKFDGEFAGSSQTYAGTGTLRYTW